MAKRFFLFDQFQYVRDFYLGLAVTFSKLPFYFIYSLAICKVVVNAAALHPILLHTGLQLSHGWLIRDEPQMLIQRDLLLSE